MEYFSPVACCSPQYFKMMLWETKRFIYPFPYNGYWILPFSWSICSKVCFLNVLPAGSVRILGITPLTCWVLWWLFPYWQDWEFTLCNNDLKSTRGGLKWQNLISGFIRFLKQMPFWKMATEWVEHGRISPRNIVKISTDPSSSRVDANYLEWMVSVCSIQLARSPERPHQLQAQDRILLALVLGHFRRHGNGTNSSGKSSGLLPRWAEPCSPSTGSCPAI